MTLRMYYLHGFCDSPQIGSYEEQSFNKMSLRYLLLSDQLCGNPRSTRTLSHLTLMEHKAKVHYTEWFILNSSTYLYSNLQNFLFKGTTH
jgi:hypothetical protein